jgi:thioredoxin 1
MEGNRITNKLFMEDRKMDTQEFVKHVDDNAFETIVLKGDKPALVDFWAPWCGPCRAIGPILEEIAKSYDGQVNVVKVNVDENPKTPELYGVRNIPTLLFIKGGKVRETKIGMLPKDQMTALIDRNLN